MAPSKGISLINQAISERRAVITRLGTLSVTAVPNGQQLLADFKQVLQQSIRADQDFIGWMQNAKNSGTCPVNPTSDASYQAGLQASRQANSAKRSFLGSVEPAGQPVRPAKIYGLADLTAPAGRVWRSSSQSADGAGAGRYREPRCRALPGGARNVNILVEDARASRPELDRHARRRGRR